MLCIARHFACRAMTLISAIAVAFFLVTAQGGWMQVNHHWFTTLFCMSALLGALVWIDTLRLSWVIIAGLAGGGGYNDHADPRRAGADRWIISAYQTGDDLMQSR